MMPISDVSNQINVLGLSSVLMQLRQLLGRNKSDHSRLVVGRLQTTEESRLHQSCDRLAVITYAEPGVLN